MTLVARLVQVHPHGDAHRVAGRVAVSVAVPLLVLWSTGHLAWSIYATFGAFASLYGRERYDDARLRLQAVMAVGFVAAVALGAVVGCSGDRTWLAVPVAGAVAMAGSALSDVLGAHPPGALFPVFAFASVSSVPTTTSQVATAAGVCAAAAGFAVLVGSLGYLGRLASGRPLAARRPSAKQSDVLRHAARAGGGVLIAGLLATAVGIGHPYWAMVSAVVPLAARDLGDGLVRGLHRLIGTFVGLAVAAALLATHLSGLLLVVVVVVLQGVAELVVGRNYALALVFITPLALLMVHLAAPTPVDELLRDRGVETLVGVAVGLVVGWATRPRTVGA